MCNYSTLLLLNIVDTEHQIRINFIETGHHSVYKLVTFLNSRKSQRSNVDEMMKNWK